MSAYPPPLQDLPIYNSVEFIEENFPLTIQDAKAFFLEYPTAQGAETLQNIVVNGTSIFNSDATINGDLEIHTPGTGLTFPDGTIQTTASTSSTGSYCYSQLFPSTQAPGTPTPIAIPANAVKCDCIIYGGGGSAGQTNAFGSYSVNGGSGGGGSVVSTTGIPLNPLSTLDFWWEAGTGGGQSGYLLLNYLTISPGGVLLGTTYNGRGGGSGQSSGSGLAGTGGATPIISADFPSVGFAGTNGLIGGSAGFPNSLVPNGGVNPNRVGTAEKIGGEAGQQGSGQRYSAFNDPNYTPSFWYDASPYYEKGAVMMTWYIKY